MLAALMTLPAAQSVSLAWDPNSETNLAGYIIYYGTASGQYSVSNNVGNVTNCIVSGLWEGTNYFFVVTAYDDSGLESDPSNEVSYLVPGAFIQTKLFVPKVRIHGIKIRLK